MNRQLYMGGGIMNAVPRENFFLGKVAKAVTKPLKKAAKTVGKIAKSDIGKAALIGAAAYYAPGFGIKAQFGPGISGLKAAGLAAKSKLGDFFVGSPLTEGIGRGGFSTSGLGKILGMGGAGAGAGKGGSLLTKGLALAGLSTFLTDKFGMSPEQAEETIANPESRALYLRRYYKNLNPNAGDEEVEEFVSANVAEYMAEGGRIGFADGPVLPPDPTQPVNPFGPKPGDFGIEEDIPIKMASNLENDKILEALFEKYIDMGLSPAEAEKAAFAEFERMSKREEKFFSTPRGLAAIGGKMDTASNNAIQAAGIEGLPVRQNPKGVKELDLRDTGGFIPPVGIKEKEDDIPAMLSNNEFVMTADAVRGMGGGNVELGAQRMYDQMKMLEAGGKV